MKEFMASTMEIKICFKLKKDIKQEFWQHFVVHDSDLNWNAYNFLFLEQKNLIDIFLGGGVVPLIGWQHETYDF